MTESKAPAVVSGPSMLRGGHRRPEAGGGAAHLELTVSLASTVSCTAITRLIPGPVWPGVALYQPGDDVRRMDSGGHRSHPLTRMSGR